MSPSPTFPRVLPPKADPMAAVMSETQMLDAVVSCAHAFGWLAHHCRPGMNRRGIWSTAIQGDAGFPDLVLVRKGHVVFAELKTERGKLSDEQVVWGSALIDAFGGAPRNPLYQVWTPAHWRDGTIEKVLR